MPIPRTAHFIWYGSRFPWVNLLALRSAQQRGGFERVVLHHDGKLDPAQLGELAQAIELRPIAGESHFEGLGALTPKLTALHARLTSPAAKANVVRMGILAREGGVYLDVDTITLRSLEPLLSPGAFCGQEHIVFPSELLGSRHPGRWARALGLHVLRAALREAPSGFTHFPRVSAWYPRAVNNAVVGAAPGHPLALAMLEAMVAMPERAQLRRFALGTHLLQQQVAAYRGDDLVVHAPELFYPLPPEVSQHWFRIEKGCQAARALYPNTYVVHWYASVHNQRLAAALDADYVRAHRDRQMFSQLAAEFL